MIAQSYHSVFNDIDAIQFLEKAFIRLLLVSKQNYSVDKKENMFKELVNIKRKM